MTEQTPQPCPRLPFTIPKGLPDSIRRQVAEFVRNDDPIHAIQLLRAQVRASLKDAKGLVLHIARVPGEC